MGDFYVIIVSGCGHFDGGGVAWVQNAGDRESVEKLLEKIWLQNPSPCCDALRAKGLPTFALRTYPDLD